MKYSLKSVLPPLCALLIACPLLAQAGIVVRGTRVIYEEAKGETIVHLRQAGETASLVQLWLDHGDDSLDAHLQPSPFVMTPSVTRMDPDSGQSIRIRRIGDGLPQDRESLLFFNVLEIPPKPTAAIEAGDNFIQFTSRARMKFFYRPKGLKQDPGKVQQSLHFSLLQDETSGLQVRVRNPSPYHATFKTLALRNGSGETAPLLAQLSARLGVHDTIVAPMSERVLPLDAVGTAPVGAGTQVEFAIVGDYGNALTGQRALENP